MDKKLHISLLLDFYGSMLSKKQQTIMEFYYNDDLSLSEVADNVGITRQGVHDTVKRTEAALLDMEDKLGLYKRFSQFEEGLSRVELLIKDAKKINDDLYNNSSLEKIILDTEEIINSLKTIN